ncbi:hypothetical protein A3F02_04115 [Candidatus Curtissbacteria bacterium RIFCSPHIGHO2_12_FULL_38_9b]|uniref:Uncharacterized protein n=2 Tax=Candidatus Curtissiibacteriota TaxID=1752717 RepID=A0A1F5GVN3_9BACT|nr:MAG: hypothetical protein A3A48_03780 [Candidatus Curtissbacteria bacterium RIFCSPLOWO2_01_FULL_37_9]OGD95970.1 MAG: hypothetical protein A3F02_04115 [Candidatus Curtissbacteria bacterium RIFCSPHIGHO2_12_FULL_38_9b]
MQERENIHEPLPSRQARQIDLRNHFKWSEEARETAHHAGDEEAEAEFSYRTDQILSASVPELISDPNPVLHKVLRISLN